jgi:hypothetical protein
MVDIKEIASEVTKRIKRSKPKASVSETEIQEVIRRLRTPRPPSFRYRRKNAKYARDVIKWVEHGQKLLTGRPDAFPPALLFRQERTKPSYEFLTTYLPGLQQLRKVKDILVGMRQQCDVIIEGKVGVHGLAGHNQERAAWEAVDLMERHGLRVASRSENSAFCTVASLLFVAMAGKSSMNSTGIARACRKVAQERNADLAFEQQMNTGTETASKN